MILSFVPTYIQASVISLVVYFQDMGGPNPVVVSDEDQVDKESVAAVADDEELDAGAEGEVANKETSNELVGGAQDKEEETVRRTHSSSKVDPPTTPPLRRGRGRGRGHGRGRPKAATSTVDTPIIKTPQEAAGDPADPPARSPTRLRSGGSDFSITPPPPRPESPSQFHPTPGMAQEATAINSKCARTEGVNTFSVSTIDESPTGKSTKAPSVSATLSVPPGTKKQKTTSRVEEEGVSVLKELGSTVKMYKDRATADKEPQKVEDDISVWAGQLERKVCRIEDPMLQEDLMDHLSFIAKQASRGQWSVNTLQSPSFTISKPTMQSVPPASATAIRQQQMTSFNAGPSTPARQDAFPWQPGQSADHLAAITQWLHSVPTSNSPGLPQAPQAQAV